jgi:hypothetical protein
MSVDAEKNLDRGRREYRVESMQIGVDTVKRLEAELAAMKATCDDYRMQACRPDECRAKTELAAFVRLLDPVDGNVVAAMVRLRDLLAENEWHPASEPPKENGSYIVLLAGFVKAGFVKEASFIADITLPVSGWIIPKLYSKQEVTHWRELPRPPERTAMTAVPKYERHEETIICPSCKREQVATVEHKWPFNAYVHNCECGYTIMESEWERGRGNNESNRPTGYASLDATWRNGRGPR